MAYAKEIDSQFFAKEVGMAWLVFSQEFGNTPEGLARLEKCRWRKGELIFDTLKEKLNIPPGSDPYTVAKTVADYITGTGYAKIEIHKVSDTELWHDRWGGSIVRPMFQKLRLQSIWVSPRPADALLYAALKKLCNVKVETAPVPQEVQEGLPKGVERRLWRLSPLN